MAQSRTTVSAAAAQDARTMDSQQENPISRVMPSLSASSGPTDQLSTNICVRHQMKTSGELYGAELGGATPEGYSPEPC